MHPRGTSSVILHAVKSYDMGPFALLPIRKECVLRIFITIKYPSPWLGSNPQPLGPVTSTLTTAHKATTSCGLVGRHISEKHEIETAPATVRFECTHHSAVGEVAAQARRCH
jgi:hypothetical protein